MEESERKQLDIIMKQEAEYIRSLPKTTMFFNGIPTRVYIITLEDNSKMYCFFSKKLIQRWFGEDS